LQNNFFINFVSFEYFAMFSTSKILRLLTS
jgi:hypothetical protein